MKKQLLSFFYAIRGIFSILVTEGHMRFHMVAAIYVVSFCLKFYTLSSAQWGVIILTISAVLVTEIINTAFERLCDKVSVDYSEHIKFVKDTAAGAVLVCAASSVAVAVVILFDTNVFCTIISYYASHVTSLLMLIVSAIAAVAFIAVKPQRYLKFLKFIDKNNNKH